MSIVDSVARLSIASCVSIVDSVVQSVAGNSKLVTGSTQFKLETLKLHNDSKKHKSCRDQSITRNTEPSQLLFSGEMRVIAQQMRMKWSLSSTLPIT